MKHKYTGYAWGTLLADEEIEIIENRLGKTLKDELTNWFSPLHNFYINYPSISSPFWLGYYITVDKYWYERRYNLLPYKAIPISNVMDFLSEHYDVEARKEKWLQFRAAFYDLTKANLGTGELLIVHEQFDDD